MHGTDFTEILFLNTSSAFDHQRHEYISRWNLLSGLRGGNFRLTDKCKELSVYMRTGKGVGIIFIVGVWWCACKTSIARLFLASLCTFLTVLCQSLK